MRENRTCGSEGGEPGNRDFPTPASPDPIPNSADRVDS